MELKYVWIKEYKNLKEIGFNIRNSKTESFDFLDGKIIISENKSNQPKDFFRPNFNGITAVVGENGSGKTNLTEFINYNLAHVTNGRHSAYIKSEGLLIVDDWIFIQKDINIDNEEELKSKGYTISKFENAPLDNGQGAMRWHKMEKNKYIYYCPQFDHRMIDVRANLINISTSYLVYNDFYNSKKSHIDYDGHRKNKYETNQLRAHYRMELNRQAELVFYNDKISDFIDFTPNKTLVGIDHESENRLLQWNWKLSDDDDANKAQIKLNNELNERLDSLEQYQLNQFKDFAPRQNDESSIHYYTIPIEVRKSTFCRLFFLRLFRILLNIEKVIFPNEFFRRFIYDELIESLEDEELNKKLESLKTHLNELIESAEWIDRELKYKSVTFSKKDKLEQKIQINNFYRNLIIDLNNNESKRLLISFIDLSEEILNEKSILHYELLGNYSSGQQLLLSFYSRFFYAKKEILESEKYDFGIEGEAIIIMIDEGETSLHPEWQRLYFNKIKNYLSALFKDYKIQLILITHSPFVLSDIPKENILFLTKDEDGNANQIEIDEEKTFGANIHDLLSNSFFMNSSIGEFAESKIKKIVDFYYDLIRIDLSEENISRLSDKYITNKEEFQYIINSIGDPIIRNILNNHVEDIEEKLFGKGNLNQRIAELEIELKKLKDSRND